MLESTSMLAALAARTSRVRLGALVAGVTYRNPALPREEHHHHRHHQRRARRPRTRSGLERDGAHRLRLRLPADQGAYGPPGRGADDLPPHVRGGPSDLHRQATIGSNGPSTRPRPIQEGGPPIIVGGTGERRTLRIAAEHADWTHWFAGSVESLRHKTEVLERHCEAVGRDPATDRQDHRLTRAAGRRRARGRGRARTDRA